ADCLNCAVSSSSPAASRVSLANCAPNPGCSSGFFVSLFCSSGFSAEEGAMSGAFPGSCPYVNADTKSKTAQAATHQLGRRVMAHMTRIIVHPLLDQPPPDAESRG